MGINRAVCVISGRVRSATGARVSIQASFSSERRYAARPAASSVETIGKERQADKDDDDGNGDSFPLLLDGPKTGQRQYTATTKIEQVGTDSSDQGTTRQAKVKGIKVLGIRNPLMMNNYRYFTECSSCCVCLRSSYTKVCKENCLCLGGPQCSAPVKR